MRDILNAIQRLYADGGIEICTYSSIDTDGAESGRPLLLARTFIQPDADIVTHLSERILTVPDKWRAHVDAVRAIVTGMRRLRRVIRSVWMTFPVPLIIGSYNAWSEFAHYDVMKLFERVAPYLFVSLGLIVFKYGVTLCFHWYLRRKR
jgi:hypothetical protein